MTEVEPAPVRRLHINVLVLLLAAICLYIAGFIAGIPLIRGSNGTPRFDWLPSLGADVLRDGGDAMLQFPGWAFALFGLTAGGQIVLGNEAARTSLRRLLGFLGLVLAFTALTFVVFAVAAVFASPKNVVKLLVFIPAGSVTWGIAVECARFVVPDFAAQRESAEAQLANTLEQQTRLPPTARTTVMAYVSILGHSALLGLGAAATTVASSAAAAGTAFVLTFFATAVGLYVFAQVTSPALLASSRGHRFWLRLGGYLMYVGVTLLMALNLIVLIPTASVGIASVFLAELLLPLAFVRLPGRTWRRWVDFSLGGALARFVKNDLDRAERSTRKRLEDLQRHAVDTDAPTFNGRLRRAVAAFRR